MLTGRLNWQCNRASERQEYLLVHFFLNKCEGNDMLDEGQLLPPALHDGGIHHAKHSGQLLKNGSTVLFLKRDSVGEQSI